MVEFIAQTFVDFKVGHIYQKQVEVIRTQKFNTHILHKSLEVINLTISWMSFNVKRMDLRNQNKLKRHTATILKDLAKYKSGPNNS